MDGGTMTKAIATTSTTLKKLKREAAHRRKLHARSLRLRAEEQERLQRLEIDALVEQQRSQRLADQREIRQDIINNNATSTQEEDACKGPSTSSKRSKGEEEDDQINGINRRSTLGHNEQDHNEQQVSINAKREKKGGGIGLLRPDHIMAAASADSRRRLARGPRNGSCSAGSSTIKGDQMMNVHNVMSEDHRVLSTEYQAAGTQAVMKVTILAAGFVIGARGISARHIGQVTGAIVHSWTEGSGATSEGSGGGRVMKKSSSNHGDVAAPAVRLFRIQGKKAVVQAAVALIQEAVAKYKELCDCKRRGDFVQREHRIGGVEFYYQPPPRKALNTNAAAAVNKPLPVPPPPLPPAHAWLPPRPPPPPPSLDRLLDWSIAEAPPPPPLPTSLLPCRPRASVASIEYAMQHVRLAAEGQPSEAAPRAAVPPACSSGGSGSSLYLRSAGLKLPAPPVTSNINNSNSHCSLFSVFGNGGLPMPIAQPLFMAQRPSPPEPLTTPFDFSSYDFLRDTNLPAIAAAAAGPPPPPSRPKLIAEYCLFGNENSCALCSQPPAAGVRLMTCGHGAFCFSCVRGKAACPLCREKILGFQTSAGNLNASFKGWPALGKGPQKTAGP